MTLHSSQEFRLMELPPENPGDLLIEWHRTHIPTALGVVLNASGTILTFDDSSHPIHNTKRAILPEGSISSPEGVKEILNAIPYRYDIKAEGRILGHTAFLTKRISGKITPRLYVPVLHTQTTFPDSGFVPVGISAAEQIWRTPEEILDALQMDDQREGLLGRQRRALARQAVLTFLED